MARFDEQPYVDFDSPRWILGLAASLAALVVGTILANWLGANTQSFSFVVGIGFVGAVLATTILKQFGLGNSSASDDSSQTAVWWHRTLKLLYWICTLVVLWIIFDGARERATLDQEYFGASMLGIFLSNACFAAASEFRSWKHSRKQVSK